MAKTETVSIDLIRRFVDYHPDTGRFFWKARTEGDCARFRSFNTRLSGKETGLVKNEKGYCLLRINDVAFKAHRIAYALMTGEWPIEIDHINGERADNRWENLRNVSHRENRANTYGWRKETSSKYIGVCRQPDCDRWKAQATVDGKTHHIGLYLTEEEAAVARDNFLAERSPYKIKYNFERSAA